MNSVRFWALFGAFLGCSLVQETFARPPSDIEETARLYDFLEKYGYFDHFPSKAEGKLPTMSEQRQAIQAMQRMAGIPQTGEINQMTAEMLSKPRCGVKDANPRDVVKGPGRRGRRYSVLGDPYKWTDKTDLTYKIMNYPGENSPDLTREQVDEDIRAAFKVWSDVTPLTFTEIHSDDADIRLLFGGRAHTRVRGDPPFDGPGGTLAHAFTPNSGWGETDGDVHLDDDETFTKGVYRGTNLFYTLAHEIGHALGLFHSEELDSLMWPYDRGYIPDYKLPQDDILGVQSLYGPNPNPPATTDPPVTVNRLYCETTFDATAFIDSEYFMFGSGMMWRFDSDRNLLSPPEGQSPRDIFPKFPSGVRAVYQEGRSGNVIVLKAKNYWVYEKSSSWSGASPQYQLKDINPDTDTDFPQNVRDLGFPKSVSGVVHLADVGFSYLIKAKRVLTFDEYRLELSESSAKVKNIFEGISERPTSAFFAQGFANVLVGQEYYRYVYDYKTSSFVALNDYPRNFAEEFLRCPAA
ncbi:matrix metalloproteinase-18-like [Patiria miniata]|uniref:Peptidase metallopeptidase domain-containing protein n=1 Tax=Patiria miniata TaxID=46514 RepID=A0A914AQ91_PATMI|nr:matrix metalloproteinase-18-like [Patiria miniata]